MNIKKYIEKRKTPGSFEMDWEFCLTQIKKTSSKYNVFVTGFLVCPIRHKSKLKFIFRYFLLPAVSLHELSMAVRTV